MNFNCSVSLLERSKYVESLSYASLILNVISKSILSITLECSYPFEDIFSYYEGSELSRRTLSGLTRLKLMI